MPISPLEAQIMADRVDQIRRRSRFHRDFAKTDAGPPQEVEGEKVSREIEQLHKPALKYCADKHWPVIYHDPSCKTGATIGCPDLIVFATHGLVYPIEFKTGTGKLSQDQRNFHHMMKTQGHSVYIVRRMEDFVRLVEKGEWDQVGEGRCQP